MRGRCWIAPKAAPKLHAYIQAVMRVVLRNWGWNSSAKLGRRNVPLVFFSCQMGESGRRRGERVEQDAPHQDSPAAEQVREIAAHHAEQTAGESGDEE